MGGQTDSQVSSQIHASRKKKKKKKHFKAGYPLFHWLIIYVNGRHSTCVDLGWVAKRCKTCFDLRTNLISTKVSASHRKSTQVLQGLAKQSRKYTQVFNMRLLASPFGQGFRVQSLTPLSLGQTDSQVVASSSKLNLRRDLRWVAKRTGKFSHKDTQVADKPISRKTFLIFHWLMIGYWTSLNLR